MAIQREDEGMRKRKGKEKREEKKDGCWSIIYSVNWRSVPLIPRDSPDLENHRE